MFFHPYKCCKFQIKTQIRTSLSLSPPMRTYYSFWLYPASRLILFNIPLLPSMAFMWEAFIKLPVWVVSCLHQCPALELKLKLQIPVVLKFSALRATWSLGLHLRIPAFPLFEILWMPHIFASWAMYWKASACKNIRYLIDFLKSVIFLGF